MEVFGGENRGGDRCGGNGGFGDRWCVRHLRGTPLPSRTFVCKVSVNRELEVWT